MTNLDTPENRNPQLDNLFNLLSSNKLSDNLLGIDKAKEWLEKDPDDRVIYRVLLDVVQNNLQLGDKVRNLFVAMKEKGSSYAETALSVLPTAKDLLIAADDAYYAAAYKQATELYRKVLLIEPDNIRAKEQLEKSTLEAVEVDSNIPREASQFFRKARSYIAAKDYPTATKMLSAAIETVEARGGKFPEAEQLLDSIQNLSIAQSFKERAHAALEKEQWRDALDLYQRVITLDPTNETIRREYESIRVLLQADSDLRSKGILKVFTKIGILQSAFRTARRLVDSDNSLFRNIEHQINQIIQFRVAAVVIIVISIIYYGNSQIRKFYSVPLPTLTPVYTLPPVLIPSQTKTPPITPTIIPTFTEAPTIAVTETVPPPTIVVLGTGYINRTRATARNTPNGSAVAGVEQNQVMLILEQEIVGNSTWYRCTWNTNDGVNDGWILGEYISLGPPPESNP